MLMRGVKGNIVQFSLFFMSLRRIHHDTCGVSGRTDKAMDCKSMLLSARGFESCTPHWFDFDMLSPISFLWIKSFQISLTEFYVVWLLVREFESRTPPCFSFCRVLFVKKSWSMNSFFGVNMLPKIGVPEFGKYKLYCTVMLGSRVLHGLITFAEMLVSHSRFRRSRVQAGFDLSFHSINVRDLYRSFTLLHCVPR